MAAGEVSWARYHRVKQERDAALDHVKRLELRVRQLEAKVGLEMEVSAAYRAGFEDGVAQALAEAESRVVGEE